MSKSETGSWEREEFWILRHKSKQSLLVLPSGQMEFTSKADAEKAIKNYKYKEFYELQITSRGVRKSSDDKIDNFLND